MPQVPTSHISLTNNFFPALHYDTDEKCSHEAAEDTQKSFLERIPAQHTAKSTCQKDAYFSSSLFLLLVVVLLRRFEFGIPSQ
mmetsp:Transcript_18439/g.25634  ORF Transcript_18439/g.25634 Transcript_18439/m.25634 type:complete len:83 (-) Transcript_18439:1748-1996(-)